MRDWLTIILGFVAGILPAWAAVYFFSGAQAFLALLFVVSVYVMIALFPRSVSGSAPVFGIASLVYVFLSQWTPAGIYAIFFFGCFVAYYFSA